MPSRIKRFQPNVGIPKFRPRVLVTSKRERDAFYASARWMGFRKAYLIENPLCRRCLAGNRLVPAKIVHHKVERLEAPDLAFEPSNLEALCNRCHSRHHGFKSHAR